MTLEKVRAAKRANGTLVSSPVPMEPVASFDWDFDFSSLAEPEVEVQIEIEVDGSVDYDDGPSGEAVRIPHLTRGCRCDCDGKRFGSPKKRGAHQARHKNVRRGGAR